MLQIANVFVNVSKGELAKHQDLQKAFGKTDTNEIVKEVSRGCAIRPFDWKWLSLGFCVIDLEERGVASWREGTRS